MLTVKEINEVSFGRAGLSGYRPGDVDSFIDQVAASFQELMGERDAAVKQAGEVARINADIAAKHADAQKKLSILAQKIEVYRQEEEGIKEAILNAQKMSKDMMRDAQNQADAILRDARAQAEAKISQANEEARRITSSAQEDAAKAAKEYAQQAESKKAELEEIKRQVTAFRSSLLEMYKKHLECIDHIPVFRQKEEKREPVQASQPAPVKTAPPAPEPEAEPVPEPVRTPEPSAPAAQPEPSKLEQPRQVRPPEKEIFAVPAASVEPKTQQEQPMAPQGFHEEPAPVRPAAPRAARMPAPKPYQEHPRQARTLNDRVNYVQEQLMPSQPPEDYVEDGDLSSVGIDLNAHSNIPEALRREKSTNYSNLPFGEGVDVDGRKHRR